MTETELKWRSYKDGFYLGYFACLNEVEAGNNCKKMVKNLRKARKELMRLQENEQR